MAIKQISRKAAKLTFYIACIIVCSLCISSNSYGADSNELVGHLQELTQATSVKIGSERGDLSAMRQSAYASLYKNVLAGFISQKQYKPLNTDNALPGLRKTLSGRFALISPLEVCQIYSESKGVYQEFYKKFAALSAAKGIKLNWKDPQTAKDASTVFKQLQYLDKASVSITDSASISSGGWNGDVRITWYPLKGKIYLFTMATADDNSNLKNIVLNITGRVSSDSYKNNYRTADLSGYHMDLGLRKLNFSGSWTTPEVPSYADTTPLFIDSRMRLRSNGATVSGTVVESIACDSKSGKKLQGTVSYELKGVIADENTVSGTYIIHGDKTTLQIRFGYYAERATGIWTGTIYGSEAKGVIKIGGSNQIPWQAKEQ